MANLRLHLTYANVIATLALFIALGGSAYAAAKLTGDDIKNRSLTAEDIKRGTLTGTEIKNHSLRSREFAPGVLLQGAKGDKGEKGERGTRATPAVWTRRSSGPWSGVTRRWLVASTRFRPRGSATVARLHGCVLVTFDRNVSQCAYSVTEGGDTPIVSAGISDPHQILAHPTGAAGDTVLVTTAKHDPPAAPANVDIPFHLIVAC